MTRSTNGSRFPTTQTKRIQINSAPRRGYGSYWIGGPDTLPANQTGVVRLQAPAGVIGAYFYFAHYGPSPADIAKAGVAPAAQSTANTATTAYKSLTFNGSAGGTVPGWILGNYPAGDKNSVQFLKSDFVGLTPVARTDFPARGHLFDVAFKCGARGLAGGAYSPTDSGNTPWTLGWTNTATDLIATPSATTMYPYMGTRVWAEWIYAGPRMPVVGAWGDSIFDGVSASSILDGYLQNSCYAAGIELYSNSIGGRTSFDTWDAMRRELPALAPTLDAVILAAWTPNDEVQGYSAASVWSRFLTEKTWIESLGLRCLIMGPLPYSASATPAIIRGNLIAAGFEFFDGGLIVATSSTLITWAAGNSGDNIHPNDVGYNLLSFSLVPWIKARLPVLILPNAAAGILYEQNSGYQALSAIVETQFATYTLNRFDMTGDFFTKRRMIREEFMTGVNFGAATARLTLNEYWNGVLVQQITINPQLTGVSAFGAAQNKALDINTQMRMESGTLAACALRGHMAYSSSFNGGSIWGDKNEYSYGQINVDLRSDIVVTWKYQWNAAGNIFYFDHIKVNW